MANNKIDGNSILLARLSGMCITVGGEGEGANHRKEGARRQRSSECHCNVMVL